MISLNDYDNSFQIKADVETKGEFINGLIQKVLAAAYTDIEDVLKFVDWLDGELSSLVICNACATIFDFAISIKSHILYHSKSRSQDSLEPIATIGYVIERIASQT